MYGKIVVIKAILLPKFTYLMQSCCVPKEVIKKLNRLFYDFLWSGKSEKVKRSTLIHFYELGGIPMVDVEYYINMLKIKWVMFLLSTDRANWKIVPRYFLDKYGDNFLIFNMNLPTFRMLHKSFKNLPDFYIDIIKTWTLYKNLLSTTPTTFLEIRKQIIWGNKFIKFQKRSLFFKRWIDSGLIFVNDIINKEVTLDHEFILNKLQIR